MPGVIVIFGTKAYRSVLATVMLVCSVCQHPAAHRIEKWTTKFTVFFIPLFPVHTRHVMQCAMCGAESALSAADAERLVADGRSQQGPAGRAAAPKELGR